MLSSHLFPRHHRLLASKHVTTVLIFLILSLTDCVSSLRCFDCGLYIPPEPLHLQPGVAPGMIIPCTNLSIEHLKQCKDSETHCMKYVNAGLEVRLCSETCVEDSNSYSEREIHCCDDDACNGSISPFMMTTSASLIPPLVSLISLILTIVWGYTT